MTFVEPLYELCSKTEFAEKTFVIFLIAKFSSGKFHHKCLSNYQFANMKLLQRHFYNLFSKNWLRKTKFCHFSNL
jgi:hypothetical protein